MMGFFAVGFTQEFFVEFYYEGILVGFSQRFHAILSVYGSSPGFNDLRISMMQRLSASTDTASGAGHHLNGMKF